MTLEAGDFDYLSSLLRRETGVVLEPGKEYLVESRLRPIATRLGCDSLSQLILQLRQRTTHGLHTEVVEAMMTGETQFFRDAHPFEAMRNHILPELIRRRAATKQLNLWCAGVSTGQEAYSLAMLIAESFPELSRWTVRCLGSDFSSAMLDRARQGKYRDIEVQRGLSPAMRDKHFRREDRFWQISDEIRSRVEFRNVNLMGDWPSLPLMDVIFLRNVLIYFDVETKKSVLGKVQRTLKPDGYLFLGTAETTLNLSSEFHQRQIDRTVCYTRRSQSALPAI